MLGWELIVESMSGSYGEDMTAERLFTGTHTSGVTRLASATFVHEAAQGNTFNYL